MKRKSRKTRVMSVFGTRPEAIKLAPVIRELERRSDIFANATCFTAQHRDLCGPFLEFFSIGMDHDLDVMTKRQPLVEIASKVMERLDAVLERDRPDIVLVQGDTCTTFAAALAAFYRGIPVGHVEAGLRTADVRSPFPEEINRRLTGRLASLHFAPTRRAESALLEEGVAGERIFVTGNPVIDSLRYALKRLEEGGKPAPLPIRRGSRRLILVTAHRRESFGEGIEGICTALAELASRNSDIELLFPVHRNPEVRLPVEKSLAGSPRVHVTDPLDYISLVTAMRESYLVLTDSGGLQEEAPVLGKPVVVMRDVTERPELIEAGGAVLTGVQSGAIVEAVEKLLKDGELYAGMARVRLVYGDGRSAGRIVRVLEAFFGGSELDTETLKNEVEYTRAEDR